MHKGNINFFRPCSALLIILTSIILVIMNSFTAWAERTPYDWALIQLDYTRQEKSDQLERFMKRIHDLALETVEDQTVVRFFEMNRQYSELQKNQPATPSFMTDIQKLRQQFNEYYIAKYFIFYDFLFVDMKGNVFYTLRNEIDNHVNLNEKKLSLGPLSDSISDKPSKETFIDFYEYGPSSEPASFFIEPVKIKKNQVGWIILQCPVNKLNSIFAATNDIGQTGETFLVNRQGLMLTESYFNGQSTILKKKLDDQNIKAKFKAKKGHLVVTDYRDEKSLSSFEVFQFMDCQWLIVAKIDKDEVTTDHYTRHKKYYGDRLLKYLNNASLPLSNLPEVKSHARALRVDMDEFLKAQDHETLETWGVSTCTALIASLPNRFGYLAHISPKDRIYNENNTDLLSQITKKLKNFDIYPYERKQVSFVIVATHLDSVTNAINQLITDGFFLSQIQVAFNSSAKSAAVVYQYEEDSLIVTWTMPQSSKKYSVKGYQSMVNIGKVVEDMMNDGTIRPGI